MRQFPRPNPIMPMRCFLLVCSVPASKSEKSHEKINYYTDVINEFKRSKIKNPRQAVLKLLLYSKIRLLLCDALAVIGRHTFVKYCSNTAHTHPF